MRYKNRESPTLLGKEMSELRLITVKLGGAGYLDSVIRFARQYTKNGIEGLKSKTGLMQRVDLQRILQKKREDLKVELENK